MPSQDELCGWSYKPAEVENIMMSLPMPIFEEVYSSIKGSGKGKTSLLYQYLNKLYPNFVQVQEIGDCTSFMMAHCIDLLKAVEISVKKDMEAFVNITATEVGYAGCRIQIGNGRLGNGDGGIGAWIADFISTYGSIDRGLYGSIDLTKYSGSRARIWGSPGNGVPKDLLNITKNHLVKTVSQVNSYESVRDALFNGYPVGVCSNQGFSKIRDKHGMLLPSGNWAHAMAIIAVDDAYSIPSCLIQNSWPFSWVSGPKRYGDEPESSFWASADVIDSMVKTGDSFVYSNFDGYPIQKLNLRIG